MNYLDALKTVPSKEVKKEKAILFRKVSQPKQTIDEMYIDNVKDSEMIQSISELRDLCDNFIQECDTLDNPLLIRHFLGYENFTEKMLELFEDTMTVEVKEEEDVYSENENDLDPSDLFDL
tara:strand:- start:2834 stop:3196 length:363 start_codon:yes stop_codon:yes gene_type:complete